MRIRMRRTETVAMDGMDFGRMKAGSVRDLPAPVAAVLVSRGEAIALLQEEGREVGEFYPSSKWPRADN